MSRYFETAVTIQKVVRMRLVKRSIAALAKLSFKKAVVQQDYHAMIKLTNFKNSIHFKPGGITCETACRILFDEVKLRLLKSWATKQQQHNLVPCKKEESMLTRWLSLPMPMVAPLSNVRDYSRSEAKPQKWSMAELNEGTVCWSSTSQSRTSLTSAKIPDANVTSYPILNLTCYPTQTMFPDGQSLYKETSLLPLFGWSSAVPYTESNWLGCRNNDFGLGHDHLSSFASSITG